MSRVRTFVDASDVFDFLDEELVYVDGPLEGYARRRRDGATDAFRCTESASVVFQWLFIPVEVPKGGVASAFEKGDTGRAVFALKDRRRSPARFQLVEVV